MKKNINNFWNKYYEEPTKVLKPSNFAKFVNKNYIKKNTTLLEIACGNGRDTFYFSKFLKKIYSIDASKKAIAQCIKKKIILGKKNIDFNCVNFKNISKLYMKDVNIIYARFFLHAITRYDEISFFNLIQKYCKKNSLLALEFRTINDKLINKGKKISKNERYTDHYRRFIDVKELKNKFEKLGYKFLFLRQGLNFSKTKKENPHLCRMIIKL